MTGFERLEGRPVIVGGGIAGRAAALFLANSSPLLDNISSFLAKYTSIILDNRFFVSKSC